MNEDLAPYAGMTPAKADARFIAAVKTDRGVHSLPRHTRYAHADDRTPEGKRRFTRQLLRGERVLYVEAGHEMVMMVATDSQDAAWATCYLPNSDELGTFPRSELKRTRGQERG